MFAKSLAFALRMIFAGLLTCGLIDYVHAQTTASEEQESVDDALTLLPRVEVKAEQTDELSRPYAGGQVARDGRLGPLGNMDLMKTPFSVSSYTSQMIENQQAVTVADVLAKDASVRASSQTGGILDSFFIRGFSIGEGNLGEIAYDGQYGVAPNYRVFSDYAERVEVLKGPAALLYGMSPNGGIGGVINIVPKRASLTDLTRLTVDYASDLQVGAHLDVSRRFGANRQFGVRLNGSHHQGDTPLDHQSRTANIGAAAFDYQGARFRTSLDVLGQEERFDAPSRPFFMDANVAVPPAPAGRRNITQPWGWTEIGDHSALLRAEYDLSDTLTLFANAGGATTDVARLSDQTHTILNAAGDTRTTLMYFKFEIDRSTADTGLRARFHTAAIHHDVTVQVSRYRDRFDRGSTNGTTLMSNLNAPITRPVQELAKPTTVPKISRTELSGAVLADTLSVLDERLLLMLGVRQQRVKSDNFSPTTGVVTSSYDKSAVTSLAGLVVSPWQNVSFYANRIEGLSKGDIAPTTAINVGAVFAPYKAKQIEVGVKLDYDSLITTLSAFEIKKPSGQLTGTVFAVDAEQRNRGLEFSLFGELTRSFRLLGGATLFDATLTKTNSAATQGKTPVGVPSWQVNLGAEWDASWLSGLMLGSDVIYTAKQYIDQTNTRSLPGWTRIDLNVRYRTQVAGKDITFRANVLNAFDRDYWAGVASYGGFALSTPRTVLLSATVDF